MNKKEKERERRRKGGKKGGRKRKRKKEKGRKKRENGRKGGKEGRKKERKQAFWVLIGFDCKGHNTTSEISEDSWHLMGMTLPEPANHQKTWPFIFTTFIIY